MKLRKYCYGNSDTKIICSECGEKCFSSSPKPEKADEVLCPHCNHYFEIDFSEDKEWYGGHDGKKDIFDVLYIGSERFDESDRKSWLKAQEDLKKTFPESKVEDATDDIHGYRLSVDIRENSMVYYKKLLHTGWALASLSFNLLMQSKPQQAKKLVEEFKQEKENGQDGSTKSSASETDSSSGQGNT